MPNDALFAANLMERIGRLTRTEEQVGDLYPAQWAVLRYLSRANRFSRTPIVMTKYLATTRGTMSQTINALERKGYVERIPSQTDKRSVNVELTDLGREKLNSDPLLRLSGDLDSALGKNQEKLVKMLEALMQEIIKNNGGQMFGQCKTCRYFDTGSDAGTVTPHWCSLLEVDLSNTDSEDICVEHAP